MQTLHAENAENADNADLALDQNLSLQLITDSLPVLVAYINQELRYVFVNKTYESWFGCERSEMQGKKLKDVLAPAVFEIVAPYIQDALRGRVAHYEVKVPSRLGGYRYIEGTYTPHFSPAGEVKGVISHVVDVSEKKRFEEALQKRQDHDQFLAEAGQILSSKLDLEQIYDSLGKIIVPEIADGFEIEMLNSMGKLELATAYHGDPAKLGKLKELRKSTPDIKNAGLNPLSVIVTGNSQCVEWISEKQTSKSSSQLDFRTSLSELGLCSIAMVPLRRRDEIVGVLSCFQAESQRRFQPADVKLVELLGYRVGLAIENALLYAETKRQKDRLYETLMRAPIAICVRRGTDLIYELANEPYQKSVGFERPLLGRAYREVFPDVSREMLDCLHRCGVLGERISMPEFSLSLDWDMTGKKSEKILNLVYEPLYGVDGRPDGVIAFGYEITDQVLARRKVEAIAENFRILTETIPNMVWTASAEGVPNYFNQRWYEFTGATVGDGFDKSVVLPEDLSVFSDRWQIAVESGGSFECEIRIKNSKTQQYQWFIVRALPVRDEQGTIEKWFGTCTEIQGQKELEDHLIHARTGAERASLAKSNFLANMSHEIRTPMTAVLGFTEFLRDPELSEEDRAECLYRIERSGQSLLRLIDDILDISKIEAGQLLLEKYSFSPIEVVREVVDMLRLQATRSVSIRTVIETDIPERVVSDPTRLRQIVVNLLGNAVKFTRTGEICVALSFLNLNSQNLLSVEVRDSGIGISPEDQSKLFSAFVQADDSITRKFGGSGLGLALSRRLAEKLGGSLELVSSEPGKGSVFRATIDCGLVENARWTTQFPDPQEKNSSAKSRRPDIREKCLEGVRILLTEDVADNRALLQNYLVAAGAVVDIAVNGKQAVDRCLLHDYDLVLMDIQMPVMDGVQATRRLRSQGFTKPIVALTAHAMKEDRETSLLAGCTDHLTKPINRNDLLQALLKNLKTKP